MLNDSTNFTTLLTKSKGKVPHPFEAECSQKKSGSESKGVQRLQRVQKLV